MRCFACANPAVIYRKYEGRAWCKRHFSRQLESKVKVTIRKNGLVEKRDRICVAASGGKDSSLALYFMSRFFGKRPDMEVMALTVDEGIGGYRDKSIKVLKKFSKKIGVELHVFSFRDEFGRGMDRILEDEVRACTYCGVFRRFIINKKARELGATKLVTGHNLDDEVQSFLINNLKGDTGRLIRLGARPLFTQKGFVTRIKPLRDLPEKETALYAMLNGIDFYHSHCPNSRESVRFDVKVFLNHMEEKYPGTKHIMISHLDALLPALRNHFGKKGKIRTCPSCGEPTSRDLCKACELIKKIHE